MHTPSELVRSTDFWFDDGTIVIQVENTLYRVYRGLLASRSTVFRDTFSIPQPATEESTQIEGCPVVQLHDRAKDFTRFLVALHHYGPYPNCPVTGFGELGSILSLSDKYDVPILRDAMVSVLCDLYPSSLENWSTSQDPSGYKSHSFDHFYALNIAVKLNIRPVLPALMYALCTSFDLEDIVSGISGRKIYNKEYRKRCIVAVPQIMLAQRKVLGYLHNVDGLDKNCKHRGVCNTERIRWLGLEMEDDGVLDPLAEENEEWDSFEVCSPCLAAAKKAYNDARQNLWHDLPSIFDLGTWEELLLPSGV
ncbi:hypothetical protein C8R44DRAFT_690952 [Mycena epipterygia]|nr:hypothetical protein C8R44DRAFT_690952 [Mycena epipterygia]